MSTSFSRFLIHNRLVTCYHSTALRIIGGMNHMKIISTLNNNQNDYVFALDSPLMIRNNNFNNNKIGLLTQIYDGLLFTQRNSKVPDKANHGARPCSHVYRYIKVECKWYGPRWYRNRLKKKFRNSENKIHP